MLADKPLLEKKFERVVGDSGAFEQQIIYFPPLIFFELEDLAFSVKVYWQIVCPKKRMRVPNFGQSFSVVAGKKVAESHAVKDCPKGNRRRRL